MTASSDNVPSPAVPRLHHNPLFWVLFSVVIVPFLFFFVTSYSQLYTILDDINSGIASQAQSILDDEERFSDDSTLSTSLAKARVALERDVVLYRHERASAALATRTWMRFMSLIFGASLVITGSIFVLGRVKGPRTSGNVQWRDITMEFVSRSPGVLLAALGSCLIAIPNLSTQSIDVDDTSTYIQKVHQVVPNEIPSLSGEKLNLDQLEKYKEK